MKTISTLSCLIILCSIFLSCQKEISNEQGGPSNSSGTFAKDASGNCSAITLNGIFKIGVAFASSNYMDITVNVSTAGSYSISTDTLNGFYFSALGQFTATGTQTVRLAGHGTPVSAGVFAFTAHYYNISSCAVTITVSPASTTAATLTLNGAPGACSTPSILGIYTAGTTLDPSNKIIIGVNVTVPGDYALSTAVVNGISFSSTGTLTATGPQNITLSGSGMPITAGTISMSITGTASSCSFPITIAPAAGGGSGTKIKRIIQSYVGTKLAYITTLTYDVSGRLSTFKEWEEDSTFTPIKIVSANYSSFTYYGLNEYPAKNTLTDETTTVDSTLYFYDSQHRVTKEDYYSGNQISVRNVYTYLSATEVVSSKYVFSAPGPGLNYIGDDTLVYDAQNRLTGTISCTASHVPDGVSSYQYDNKNNPFALINLFKYVFTLYGEDERYNYRSPNNLTIFNSAYPPSATSILFNYSTYNSSSYPVYATGSITDTPNPPQYYTMRFEYY